MQFNNKYILDRIEENRTVKNTQILRELKSILPISTDDLKDMDLLKLYNKAISIHQQNMQGNGNFLENDILVKFLDNNNISYRKQVSISKDGIIIGFDSKKNKCYHMIDFVIGKNIQINKSIKNYIVISCKTTCRERWTQDNWTFIEVPKKYILLTLSDDYPLSVRFRENSQRKIITCIPKKKDDRIYKLNYENLIEELQ